LPHKILFVEDDADFNELITEKLERQGYLVRSVMDGAVAVQTFREFEPDLVLLDWQLPGKSGIEITKELKEFSMVPIIMVTAKNEAADYDEALNIAGAEDFIDKLEVMEMLLPRVKVNLMRRPITEANKVLRIGPLRIDLDAHEVKRDEEKLSLTPLEFNLLCTLAAKPNLVFSREMLLDQVWGYQYKADTRLVNVHIQRLRSKIEEDPENPKYVLTVRGAGYKAGQS
jgi:two-component system, OmpR family, response regulator MtrA